MLTPTKKTSHHPPERVPVYNLNYPLVFVVRYRHQVLKAGVDDFIAATIARYIENQKSKPE